MSNGLFSGNPRTEWLSDRGDDRRMRLLEPFWYLDPQGRRWDVPAGTVINGASIPRTLWSAVGTPYTGDYRRASVVHDAAIHTPEVVRGEADTMFYYACLTGGCTLLQAKLLYGGVRIGSWADEKQFFAFDVASMMPDAYRLPGQLSPKELEVRARYTLIASQLLATPNEFDEIRATVDRSLR